jgi:hypothetical protein
MPRARKKEAALVPMMTNRMMKRWDAKSCWRATGGVRSDAVRMFLRLYPGTKKRQAKYFVKRWGPKEEVEELLDRPRSGAPRKVPLELLRDCAALIKAGPGRPGGPRYYRSIKEAIRLHPTVNHVMKEYGLGAKSFSKMLSRADPDMVVKRMDWKRELAPHIRDERKSIAIAMLNRRLGYFKRIMWLDGTHLYITSTSTGRTMVCSEKDLAGPACGTDDFRRMSKLSWYMVVGWHGLVAVVPVSGCKPSAWTGLAFKTVRNSLIHGPA